MNTSPFIAITKVQGQLKALINPLDLESLDEPEKKATMEIRRIVMDLRLDIRDYELSETRDEQLKCATIAKKRLKGLEKNILAASNVFGSSDVAQLGAQLEQINERLV
jgi:hypothetical protein